MKERIRIDRLHVDLRGLDPAVAEAVVPLLGSAVQQAMSRTSDAGPSAANVDAGRVSGSGGSAEIAHRIAAQVAQRAVGAARGRSD